MALIEQQDAWVPTKFHGEVPFPEGADPQAIILLALNSLVDPSQRPAYRDIKYQVKPTTTIAASGKDKFTPKKVIDRTIFFELT